MKRQRLAGIEKEISRVISSVLLSEIKNPNIRGLVSVTKVRVTEDLKFADTYFSIMPPIASEGQKTIEREKILEALEEVRGFLRKRIAEEINLRFIPEIRVKLDDSIEHAIHITKLLNDLKGS
ncbi:ribosome-binding factor A [Fusobacterium necrophorum subsp. funduliforme]|uniref:Ribosome-binding factor A n=5 Tax=Fusobacterium necrophorum TaxID=859 RepID=A0AAN3VTR4_9FUSO|nr:30S ribosome-binding factor RbfA [Fusobacterium necrophorum]EHO18485.1 ribosome-binding factor A [Fusobacterium necrophorum subsp. funduliforme 1_1_36S]AVQ21966.1 30S ribosome-binding factor RbfA [Fusobacterium necrophorum subsp. funduliforme]AYV95580.1 30S ribosome-binding factor RbfA [Fusobacterium necrophorum subsp. funduliforme]AYZ74009.1 30S ribosome-binding factor RbfA [Fusobacterium necrophorum]AZW10112.1 30S ribosome-binding factor RbfA [Fusobacterium necrophorum subsp. necrophorum]